MQYGLTLYAHSGMVMYLEEAFGFELKRQYVKDFYEKILPCYQPDIFVKQDLEDIREARKQKQLEFAK